MCVSHADGEELESKRDHRLKVLKSLIGRPCDKEVLNKIVERIMKDIAVTIEMETRSWNIRDLKFFSKQPIPFDSSNPRKPCLYIEICYLWDNKVLSAKLCGHNSKSLGTEERNAKNKSFGRGSGSFWNGKDEGGI